MVCAAIAVPRSRHSSANSGSLAGARIGARVRRSTAGRAESGVDTDQSLPNASRPPAAWMLPNG